MATANKSSKSSTTKAPVKVKKAPKTFLRFGEKSEDGRQQVIIRDVTFFWVKCDPDNPVEPFGTLQWECQIRFPEERNDDCAQVIKESWMKECQEEEWAGWTQVNLSKRAELKGGGQAKPIIVLDADGEPLNPKIVGNGSTGHVRVFCRDYQTKSPKGKVLREGTAVDLHGIKVMELEEYTGGSGGLDFDE